MIERLKTLFFNETLRQWHFEALLAESGISRERLNHFLKEFLKEEFIKRVKPKKKMPYYIANRDAPRFRSEKRLYGLEQLEKSGLFEHLNTLEGIKTAILFGSFARGDWSKSSDIDLFIYGDDPRFDKKLYEKKLKREIQTFAYTDPKQIKTLDKNLIPNIVKGFHITESIEPFEVSIHA
ncbi:nucleotidyltransferase domain-containing protein [Candidatus Woesearchaeota archaeon]|nr:nucleotidyltransferase domain-containing protein [Candidatus Woesearchaeota archaeon]